MASTAVSPDPRWAALLPRPLPVTDVVRETADVWTLTLDPGTPHRFAPGQFNMLYVFGSGEVPISISGDPARPEALVHTIRAVGAVTDALCAARAGQRIGVRGPYGTPWPVEQAKGHDVVVVAGGVGLAPLRPAIYQLLAQRREYGRIAVLYGARTPDDLLFKGELLTWRARFDLQVQVTVDSDRSTSPWRGDVGVVTHLIQRAAFDPTRTFGLVCGPEVMMRFGAQVLLEHDLPAERIYLSAERNMKCAVGHCGHCQYGPDFVCKDGPVYPYPKLRPRMRVREL